MESAAAVQLSKDQEKNLIALIKEREVLWEDTNNIRKHNQRNTAWDEIGVAMSHPAKNLKKNYENLRSSFLRYLKTELKNGTDIENIKPENTKELYKGMLFLLPKLSTQIKKKGSNTPAQEIGNITPSSKLHDCTPPPNKKRGEYPSC